MRLDMVTCAAGSGQAVHGARTKGKTDGSVIATLKQGHSVSAADTAILRGCIILVQSLHYPPVNRSVTGHAEFFGSPQHLDLKGEVNILCVFLFLHYIRSAAVSQCVRAM